MLQPSFDAYASALARDEGMARVAAGAPAEWAEAALEAVRATAQEMPVFVVDDVWGRMDVDPADVRDLRVMGAVMRRAVSAGYAAPTGQFGLSARVSSHRGPRRVWRSLLYEEGAP